MTEEITLANMAAFDFSKPVTVTIFYDDSDEDTNDVITLLCGDDEYSTENKSSSETLENKTKRKCIDDIENNVTLENKRTCLEIDDNNHNSSISHIQNSTKTNNVSNDIEVTDVSNNGEITFDPKPATVNQLPTIETNIPIDKRTADDSAIASDDIDVNLMRKEFQKVGNYIQNLLTNVSEHLILIVNAYQKHCQNVNENESLSDGHLRTQASKARYNRYKNHIFQLSYSAVVSVILQQESNNGFIESFLHETVVLARDKSQFKYTPQYIEPFFSELVSWVKQKRNSMSKIAAQEHNNQVPKKTNHSPLLAKQLSQSSLVSSWLLQKPSRENNNTENGNVSHDLTHQLPAFSSTPSNQKQQPSNILSSGPPGREVRVEMQPNLLQIQNQQMAQITNMQPRTHQPPPPYPSTHSHSYYNCCRQGNQQRNNQTANNLASNGSVAPGVNFNISNQYTNHHAVSERNWQYTHQVSSANISNSQRLGMERPCQPVPTLREFRPHQNQNTHQGNRSFEHQYSSKDRDQAYLEELLQSQDTSPKNVVENARSVSTDSGIASPLQFNPGGDKTPSVAVDSAQYPQFAPYITHVTSLNPNAVQISLGSCHVCKKPTKTKCIGCYQVYYCNYECLNADWNNHLYVCKTNTGR